MTTAVRRADRGSIAVLAIGMVVICVMAFTVLVDVSAAVLQRHRLQSLVDGAALAGAQAIDLDAYYEQGAAGATGISARVLQSTVRHFLAEARLSDRDLGERGARFSIDEVSTDGRTVTVRLSEPMVVPFLSGLVDVRLSVQSRSQLAYAEAPGRA